MAHGLGTRRRRVPKPMTEMVEMSRSWRAAPAILAAALVMSCGSAAGGPDPPDTRPSRTSTAPTEQQPTITRTPPDDRPPTVVPEPAEQVADPAVVSIPAIGVEANLVGLGLMPSGAMEVPEYDENQASWYVEGPRPGEVGPAVIAGHVDSATGPDVFFDLRELTAGDGVTVTDEAGESHHFTVDRLEQHDKDGLPYRKIWGPTPGSTLRLITCAGSYDSAAGAYRQNLIVYADARA